MIAKSDEPSPDEPFCCCRNPVHGGNSVPTCGPRVDGTVAVRELEVRIDLADTDKGLPAVVQTLQPHSGRPAYTAGDRDDARRIALAIDLFHHLIDRRAWGEREGDDPVVPGEVDGGAARPESWLSECEFGSLRGLRDVHGHADVG